MVKKPCLFSLLLALTVLLTACGGGQAGGDAQTAQAQGPETTQAAGSVQPSQAASVQEPTIAREEEEATAEAETTPAAASAPGQSQSSETQLTPAPEETATPAPEGSENEAPSPAPESTQEELPYSQKTADTVLTVTGSALERDWYFTLAQLQSCGGYEEGDYFSRGKDPQELVTHYGGIRVQYLIEQVLGVTDYKKVTFTASDGYAGTHSKGAIGMTYLNEQDDTAALHMLLAWEEDGAPCALRLVMGQQVVGEYNRTYWVRDVVTVEIKGGT
jgi:hypothetical protein